MKKDKGILLFAVGHPYYGRMAYNLAITIKATGTELPIAVIHDESALKHLTDEQREIFDFRKKLKETPSSICALRLKAPTYSPFKETLALDVDMVWIGRKPDNLFDLLNDRDFTIVNEGHVNIETGIEITSGLYTHWADLEDIKKEHDIKGDFYQVRGEFLLFRKGKIVNDIYAAARKVQSKPNVKVYRWADGDITDEFSLNIGMNQAGAAPHKSNWQPTYWPMRQKYILPALHILNKEYFALSLGGNRLTSAMRNMHDIVVQAASQKLGLPFVFTIQPKRNFLAERKEN